MNSLRIAYILSSTDPLGGATKAFMALMNGMRQKGVEPFVVLPDRKGIYQHLVDAEIKTFVGTYRPATYTYLRDVKDYLLFLPRMIARQFVNHRTAQQLQRWLTDNNVDIVHTNVSIIDIGYKAAKRLNIPHIYHIREYGDKIGLHHFPSKRTFLRQLNDKNSYSICITNDVQHYHQQGLSSASCVIYDGVHKRMEHCPSTPKQDFFLYAGRIEPAKGLDILIRGYAQYVATANNILPLHVAGEVTNPLFHKKILQQISQYQLEKHIKWLGNRNDLEQLMQQAKALIIPSRFEGFGLCMPEAMFNGCLCIGKNVAGTKEQLDNGLKLEKTEIALHFEDEKQLADHLKNLTEQPISDYQSMIENAFHAVNTLYSQEAHIENVYQFYNKIRSNNAE